MHLKNSKHFSLKLKCTPKRCPTKIPTFWCGFGLHHGLQQQGHELLPLALGQFNSSDFGNNLTKHSHESAQDLRPSNVKHYSKMPASLDPVFPRMEHDALNSVCSKEAARGGSMKSYREILPLSSQTMTSFWEPTKTSSPNNRQPPSIN